ncbi:MAG: cell division protein [Euryarchaeota archaeon]|nr:cell division protein [Euryarchaeota archaeon]
MKVLIVGIGQAGGKIADQFLMDDRKSHVPHTFEAIAINTAVSDLTGLGYIPNKDRILVGETLVKGHGVGADNKKAAQIAEDDIEIILNRISKSGVSNLDAFFLVASLGGGTGSGTIPIVARHLKRIYDEPVYAIAVIPADNEGDIYTLNTARSLKALLPNCDAVIVVDNGAFLKSGESVKEAYDRINGSIVKRLGILCRAGEARSRSQVGEKVVDASEIINTLQGGGICSIGYASEEIKGAGILSKVLKKKGYELGKASRILSVVKHAVKENLFLPCDYTSANKALIIIAGPPEELDRKGIEKAREWLEDTIAGTEVRGGDYPLPKSGYVGCVVLLAGIANAPRIKTMLERAKVVQEKIGVEPKREKDLDKLLGGIESIEDAK